MAKIDQRIIDHIKDVADIVEVVGDLMPLKRAGMNQTGICPFHDDHHDGNFIVRPRGLSKGNIYYCFACHAKGDSVRFLMEHPQLRLSFPDAIRWLGRKYGIEVDDVPLNYTPPPPRPLPPPLPTLEIPRAWVKRTMELTEGNTFVTWFASLPWTQQQRERLHETLWMYAVGAYTDGSVCWWQIDENGVARAAKLMKYHADGHRMKGKFDTSYLYAKPSCKELLDPDHHNILHPLFGCHLLKRFPSAVVNVVESEKTALIMANFYGSSDKQLWLACGGLQNMRLESMQPLIDQGRTVWLWPDKDGQKDWQVVADKLGSDKVNVYTKFFETCWRPEDGEKADAADIILRMMTQPQPKKAKPTAEPKKVSAVLRQMCEMNPALQVLINTFDLNEK